MSDGNTAIQVSPVALEGEAMRIFNFLNGAANAIVERSNLAKEVGEMQAELKRLREDCDNLTASKENLSERLGWTRNELSDEQAKNGELIKNNYHKAQRIAELEASNVGMGARIERLTQERDSWITRSNDNEFQLLQTQDHLASAEKTLADIRHAMGWKEPEPKPEDVEGKDANVGQASYESHPEQYDDPNLPAAPISDAALYFPPSDVAEVKPDEETTPAYHDDSNRYF